MLLPTPQSLSLRRNDNKQQQAQQLSSWYKSFRYQSQVVVIEQIFLESLRDFLITKVSMKPFIREAIESYRDVFTYLLNCYRNL